MFPIKLAGTFFDRANTAGTINSSASLAAALKLPKGAVDLFELRLDAFADSPHLLLKAIPRLNAPLLITVRDSREGGQVSLTVSRRAALYSDFLPHAALIDLELRNMKALRAVVENAKSTGVKIIASFHDFKATPRAERLVEMRGTAKAAGADLFKAAALTQKPGDIARLLALFDKPEIGLSVMGMGELGKASRLLFAQAGSVVNYGFLDPKAAVSGQWPAQLLKKRIAELGSSVL